MSDDLVKWHIEWLRGDHEFCNPMLADRIEELEAKLRWVLQERDATFALMLARAETAEAKLTKAVEVLIRADKNLTNLQPKIPQLVREEWIPVIDGYVDPVIEACRATLAELTGG